MNNLNKTRFICLLFCFPYMVADYINSYYFDYILKKYPVFLPPSVLIIIIFPIYIGLGYLCGKKRNSKVCILGTIIHLSICMVSIEWLLPFLGIKNGVAQVWFPIWTITICICQLIGYWGAKQWKLNHVKVFSTEGKKFLYFRHFDIHEKKDATNLFNRLSYMNSKKYNLCFIRNTLTKSTVSDNSISELSLTKIFLR